MILFQQKLRDEKKNLQAMRNLCRTASYTKVHYGDLVAVLRVVGGSSLVVCNVCCVVECFFLFYGLYIEFLVEFIGIIMCDTRAPRCLFNVYIFCLHFKKQKC